VLYRPPVKSTTWLLWGGPFVLLSIARGVLVSKLRKRSVQVTTPLSDTVQRQAASLLGGHEGKS